MNSFPNRFRALAGLLALVPLAAGCASQKALKDYQDEVRALREEKTQLKKENRALQLQVENYEVRLAEAAATKPAEGAYPELDEQGIGYGTRGGNFMISVPAEITFASGKADLTAKGKTALQTVAQVLKADHANGIYWIEGHTDSDPIKKSKWNSNRELSMFRALAVLHFLVEDAGVPDEQCVVAGHGEYMPVAPNDATDGKAKNRRVEIVVHTTGS
ncbi:MAG: OmpA family protein [Planctomycetota bacterium]